MKIYSSSASKLQTALDSLAEWSDTWQLQVAPQKCQILHLGGGPEPPLTLAGSTLEYVSTVRDLGVTVDTQLSFGAHCERLAKEAKRAAFLTLRCFRSSRVEPLLRAYITYVRPKLEYASQVYSPALRKHSEILERVQRYYTRRIFAKCRLKPRDYDDRLKFLGIDRLDIRRTKLDLMLCYKVYHSMIDNCDLLKRQNHDRTPRFAHHIVKESNGCLARVNFFSNRVVAMWNKLPADVALGAETSFKRFISL